MLEPKSDCYSAVLTEYAASRQDSAAETQIVVERGDKSTTKLLQAPIEVLHRNHRVPLVEPTPVIDPNEYPLVPRGVWDVVREVLDDEGYLFLDYVYFIEAVGLRRIKIGRTRCSPVARLAGMQTGCPVRLKVLRSIHGKAEPEFHEIFKREHVHGEWFKASPRLRQTIAALEPMDSRPIDAKNHGFVVYPPRKSYELHTCERAENLNMEALHVAGLAVSLDERLQARAQYLRDLNAGIKPMRYLEAE